MAVRIASWNVNSVKARLPNLVTWLREFAPDAALLQETKCVAENFPRLEIEALGYHVAVAGQKTYNGVAILSKTPLTVAQRALPGDPEDAQARYIEATTESTAGTLRLASVYLPNGNPVTDGRPGISEKFAYKLAWLARLAEHARGLLKREDPVVLGGDYNVIPEARDCHDPEAWAGDALFRAESRAGYRRLLYLGLTDAFRALHPEDRAYSFWDYQRGAWRKDDGVRIDHLLLSPQATDRLRESGIDRTPRGRPKPSDHTPVWCTLAADPEG